MKKLLLLLMLLPVMAGANDLQVVLSHTIVAADTIATAVICDTAESPIVDIRDSRYVQFFSTIEASGVTVVPGYTNDSFHVDFMTSADRSTWIVHEIDTFLTIGSSWSPLNMDADATVFGNWAKARVIYRTAAIAADQPDSVGNVRGVKLKLWYMLK